MEIRHNTVGIDMTQDLESLYTMRKALWKDTIFSEPEYWLGEIMMGDYIYMIW